MAAGVLNSGLNLSPPEQMSEEDKFQERKRDILVLVMRFLADYGYLMTYQSLCTEASMTLDQVDAADNIDLMTIVQEFVDYYHSKFGRYPKLIRHNYMPQVSYQMQQQLPSQQLAQVSMHALRVQAAALAAAAAASSNTQPAQQQQQTQQQQQVQQQRQQQQQIGASAGPQVMLPPPIIVSQTPPVLPVSLSGAMSAPMDCSMPLDIGSGTTATAVSTVAGVAGGLQQLSQQQGVQQVAQQGSSVLPKGPLSSWPQRQRQHTNLASSQGSTKRIGATEPLDQEGFVTVLQEVPPSDLPSKHLEFRCPLRNKGPGKAKRSDKLTANDIQEEVMYALVGCTDIGWSSRNVNEGTRKFLQEHYNIDKGFVSTFFKNRSQRKPYNNPNASSTAGAGAGAAKDAGRKGNAASTAAAGGSSSSLPGSRSSSSNSNRTSTAATVRAKRRQDDSAIQADASAATAQVVRSAAGLPLPLLTGAAAVAAAGNFAAVAALRAGLSTAGSNVSATPRTSTSTAAAAAAAMADVSIPDGNYSALDSMSAFGLCSPPSLPGLSAAMSLPSCLDNEGYLRSISSDLDAADMTLGASSGGCISPCGFSA